jgi:CheY-like chemotaxis protein
MTGVAARVLVVDDEPQILRALRTALAGHGYEVQTATNGDEALDAIAIRPPDVVVLDLVMPGRSGFDVVKDLRVWSQVPIVVLSARGQERDKVTALDLGADDYLTKPFGMDELLARIRVALRHRAGAPDASSVVRAGGSRLTWRAAPSCAMGSASISRRRNGTCSPNSRATRTGCSPIGCSWRASGDRQPPRSRNTCGSISTSCAARHRYRARCGLPVRRGRVSAGKS